MILLGSILGPPEDGSQPGPIRADTRGAWVPQRVCSEAGRADVAVARRAKERQEAPAAAQVAGSNVRLVADLDFRRLRDGPR